MSNEVEQKFHKSRIAFMIIDGELVYLSDSGMSHREWYVSLGLDESLFDSIVRGYYKSGKVLFYKGNFECDDEVINCAASYGNEVKEYVDDENALVYAGVIKGEIGQAWEPLYLVKTEVRKK